MKKYTNPDLQNFDPIFYATREHAQAVVNTLPPFKASRFNVGLAIYKIVEFTKGYAIQLGDYGNYHPRTNADLAEEEAEILEDRLSNK